MSDKPYLQKGWLTGQAKLLESMNANQRAINTQVASEYSFNELMKELKNA